MSITFLYKNLLDNVTSITENCSASGWGTGALSDNDLNYAFRGTATVTGTTTVLFTFGSAIYADSLACVNNLTSLGSLILRAGVNTTVSDFTTSIPVDGLGTSHKFFGNNGYRYWRLDFHGATGLGQHQCNELFIGKRNLIIEMPSYPVDLNIEEDCVELVSERGQRWIYYNYERENWVFNFEGVNATTESDLFNMYKYVRKDAQPIWMCLDPENNPMDIKYVRFKNDGLLSDEITKNVYDITIEIEQEI